MGLTVVTGGRGFLGSHLVRRLVDAGRPVRILARRSRTGNGMGVGPHGPGARSDLDSLETVWTDIRDVSGVDRAIAGAETVIHLVSNFRHAGSDRSDAAAINIEGTRNVLEACKRHGVKRLVHCSTIGVHGSVKQIPADEQTDFNPGDIYQETKLAAEQLVWDYHRQIGLPVVVVRPISLFGPGDLRMFKLFRLIRQRRFVIMGSGEVLFQPAYIDDVIRGFELCLDHDGAVGQAFIIGGSEYVSINQLTAIIAQELGVTPPRWHVPLKPVWWLAAACEAACALIGTDPPLHRRRVSFFANNRAFRIDKARTLLGFEPRVSLREGIARTISWYRQNQLLPT